jgi:hypothetical protein
LADARPPRDYVKLWVMVRTLADTGLPVHGQAVNYLRDGLWEFKIGSLRLTFYDTEGAGECQPKPKIRDIQDAASADHYWWFPRFAPTIRLGHYWLKSSQRANPADINRALQLRAQDLAHDRPRTSPR